MGDLPIHWEIGFEVEFHQISLNWAPFCQMSRISIQTGRKGVLERSRGPLAAPCWKPQYSYRNIEVLKPPKTSLAAPKRFKTEKSQQNLEIWNIHKRSWKFLKFLENCVISLFLTNFLENGGSETLIFLGENNDLGADPPKVPLLAKFTEKWRNSIKSCPLPQNSKKSH